MSTQSGEVDLRHGALCEGGRRRHRVEGLDAVVAQPEGDALAQAGQHTHRKIL